METFKKPSFFILAALFASTVCCAQTADEIVKKNIDAVGGRDLLLSVKSVVIESDFDFNGNGGTSTTYILFGKGFKSVTDMGGTKFIQCITDKGGWTNMGQPSASALPDDVVKQSQGQLKAGGPLVDYSANGGKIELVGKDTADYKIHLSNSLGTDATYYINMKTYYIDMASVKTSMGGQSMDRVIRFSDYKKTDIGVVMAGQQSIDTPQGTVTIVNKKIEVNKAIDPAIFDMPK